jgi:hypothetical protein
MTDKRVFAFGLRIGRPEEVNQRIEKSKRVGQGKRWLGLWKGIYILLTRSRASDQSLVPLVNNYFI